MSVERPVGVGRCGEMVAAKDAKQWAADNVVGLFASPLTTFDDEFNLKLDGLVDNVHKILDIGVEGMGYGHSEPWALSHEERRISAQAFVDAVGGKAITYVHAHDHSAPESVAFTNRKSVV